VQPVKRAGANAKSAATASVGKRDATSARAATAEARAEARAEAKHARRFVASRVPKAAKAEEKAGRHARSDAPTDEDAAKAVATKRPKAPAAPRPPRAPETARTESEQQPRLESVLPGETVPPLQAAEGSEGGGRRRRGRRGRGDRGERPEQGAQREIEAVEAHPHAEPAPTTFESVVVPLAAAEPSPKAIESAPPIAAQEPVAPLAQPVSFHSVSEHDDSESHHPVRRRQRRGDEGRAPEAPLQLVETQVPAAPIEMDDELPRRTKPRRRRSAPMESGKLMLVETQSPKRDAAAGRQPTGAMSKPIDFYFEFSSPYGYIASQIAEEVEARIGRPMAWRPMLLGPVFKITGQQPLVEVPMKGEYSKRDFVRSARQHKLPFRYPEKFPIGTVAAVRAFYWVNERDPEQARKLAKALYSHTSSRAPTSARRQPWWKSRAGAESTGTLWRGRWRTRQ
jgi:hypothetical protein